MKLASQQLKREEAAREMAESGCVWVGKKTFVGDWAI